MDTGSDLTALIRPVRSIRLSQVAADQIIDLIESGHFKVGDKLPNERALVEQLGVSRASVREALREIEQQGWIEVRAGKGSFVISCVPPNDILPGLEAWFRAHGEEVNEVIDVREVLEVQAATLAAERCTSSGADRLRDLIAKMHDGLEQRDLVGITYLDREFHRQIFAMSENQFLSMLGESIVTALFGPRHSILRINPRVSEAIVEHVGIADAIASRDPARAQVAIRLHMAGVRRMLQSLQAGFAHKEEKLIER